MATLLFVSTFITVFALGFQSQNVNNGHYLAAALASFFIGAGNLFILKLVPDGDGLSIAAYLIAGPIAIVTSMIVHRHTLGKRSKTTFYQPKEH